MENELPVVWLAVLGWLYYGIFVTTRPGWTPLWRRLSRQLWQRLWRRRA
jgi:hypothetical protein